MLLHCKPILAVVISLAALFGSPCSAPAADQTGAEKVKLPVKDAVKWNGESVGNIQVTYADGTKDQWTTKGGCGLARVAADGTVGWNVFEGERRARSASYNIRPHSTIVLCRVQAALGFVEEWNFTKDGKRFVVKSRALHGPATIELRETDTGKVVQSVQASDANVPAWAAPYRE